MPGTTTETATPEAETTGATDASTNRAVEPVAGVVEGGAPPVEDAPAQAAAGPAPDTGDLRERLARVSAELDNFRKRSRREHAESLRYAHEDLARALLNVADNLERAHQAGADVVEAQGVMEGVQLTLRQLKQTLAEYGVREIPALGLPFDPEHHEAVGTTPSPDVAPGTVVEELQRGYRLHDRVLRPARVIVTSDAPQ